MALANINQRKVICRTSFRTIFSGIKWKQKVGLFGHREQVFFLFSNRALRQDVHSCETILEMQWSATRCTQWRSPLLYWIPTMNNWSPKTTPRSRPLRPRQWTLRKGTKANGKVKGWHDPAIKLSVIKRAHIFNIKMNAAALWGPKQMHVQQPHSHDHLHLPLNMLFSLS